MPAVIERKYNTFRGIPNVLSNLTKTTPNIKAESNAPKLSISKIFFWVKIIVFTV